MESTGKLDAIFVPVGGGGLVAGIGAYVRALKPYIKARMEERGQAGQARS